MMRIEKTTGVLNILLISVFLLWCIGWLFTGAWFAHPNAEDLSLTSLPRDIGIIPSTVNVMVHYDGRYFTNILHGLNPLAFDWLQGYKLMPVFGIVFLAASFYFFINTLFIAANRYILVLFSLLFTIVHFATVPSLPHDLYWMVSSFVYLYPAAFTFLWLGCYIRYVQLSPEKNSIVWFLATATSLLCCIGLNEMFLVSNFLLLLIIAFFAFTSADKWTLRKTIPVLITGFACIAFFVTSPGISERAATKRDPGAGLLNIAGILHGTSDYKTAIILLLKSGLIIFSSLLTLVRFKPFSFRHKNIETYLTPLRLLFIVLGLFLVSFLMTLAFYIPMQTELDYPARIFDSTVIPVQLVFFILVPLLFFKYTGQVLANKIQAHQNLLAFICLSVLLLCLWFSDNNITRLCHEYYSGSLQRFDNTMCNRYAAINKTKLNNQCWQVAIIDTLSTPKSVVYFTPDIGHNRDPAYWNNAYEIYFKVDEVKRKGDTATKL